MPQNPQNEGQEFQAEYQHIKSGVKKAVVINLLIIAVLVGLFFVNKHLGWIDKLTNRF